MAMKMTNIISRATATRSQIYAAPSTPANLTSVVFDGTISNVDTTNKAIHYLTLELRSGNNYFSIGNAIAVPFGLSPRLPKIVLKAGESLYITGDAANVIDVVGAVVERS